MRILVANMLIFRPALKIGEPIMRLKRDRHDQSQLEFK